jgi:hypothetical protein
MHSQTENIDFVLTWVDGSDPAWRASFDNYALSDHATDIRKSRYREWENLRFWFRAVEKYAPWVHKIHFVTWGHVPTWLNPKHPKLNIVKHDEYLDRHNVPVFNSHPIEINLHRIKDLSDQFVYFNDDTFLLAPIKPTRFFMDGLPRDIAVGNVISIGGIENTLVNDVRIINRHFSKRDTIRQNFFKWFNPRYGLHNMKTICLMPWKQFTGFFDPHQAQPYLKTTFEEVWKLESETLQLTSASKFRSVTDVNQYLFRYWQLVTGKFIPVSIQDTKYIDLRILEDCKRAKEYIDSGRFHQVCFNDKLEASDDFEDAKSIINAAFARRLPDKSSFEL